MTDWPAKMVGSSAVRMSRLVCRLGKETGGVSILEFALILPVLLTLGLYGTEVSYMAMVNMEVGEIATSVADNAARLGQTDNSAVTPDVKDPQVNTVMTGGMLQGDNFDFQKNGRIILSSLEKNANGEQYIHWQRCAGALNKSSAYGGVMTVLPTGMGKDGHKVLVPDGTAVMFVEVYYNYQPLFGTMFAKNLQFSKEAALLVRDNRNLSNGIAGTGCN